MKVLILLFSGTGNTELVTRKYEEELLKLNIDTTILKMEEIDSSFDVSEYDRIGFAYPVHGFNAPKIVLERAKLLVNKDNKDAFTIMVSGEPLNLNHSSSWRLSQILKKKNIFIKSEYHYVMPYNMIFRHTEARAFEMFDVMCKLVPLDVKDYFVLNKENHLKKVFLGSFYASIVRIEQPAAPFIGKFYRVNMKKCVKCMKCVNSCPRGNIVFTGDKFKFKNNCLICTRCSFNCPQDAFNIGILNAWRVNKPYQFKKTDIEEIDKHKKYCRKAYLRYFSEAKKRIEESN